MMEILAFIAVWYASGLLGSFLALNYWWRRNRECPLDIDVGDILFGSFLAIFGPVNLLVGALFFASWVFGCLVDTRRTVFKARR